MTAPDRPFAGSPGESSALHHVVRRARARITSLRAIRLGSAGAAVGGSVAILAIAGGKLRLWPQPAPWEAAALVAGACLTGCAASLALRPSELSAARATERRAGLKERLSSALEFESESHDEPVYQEQLRDAVTAAQNLDLGRLYPARLPHALLVALLEIALIAGIFFLPGLPIFISAKQSAEMAEVKAQGIQIMKLARDAEKQAGQKNLAETRRIAAELRKLGEQMKSGRLNKKQALVAQAKLTRQMQEAQRKLADRDSQTALQQAAKRLADSIRHIQQKAAGQKQQAEKVATRKQTGGAQQSRPMQQALSALKKLQQAMQRQNPAQMQQAMQQLAQAMQQPGMSRQQMQSMARALQQTAQAMQGSNMNQVAQQMQQLAQAMQNANPGSAQTMQQLAGMAQQLGQQMSQQTAQAGSGMLDGKAMAALMAAFNQGKLTTMMGDMMGQGGRTPGRGWNGQGHAAKAMKQPANPHPKLLALGQMKPAPASGKSGSAAELSKYLKYGFRTPANKPNAQVKGVRSQKGQELSTNMMGAPEGTASSMPYYEAAETSRREAESALNRERIPVTMKNQVKDYFDNLTPGGSK